MSLKSQLSFSTGELDPILQDRITLEKFKKALSTGRNVMIGKTGTILTRFATGHVVAAKNADEQIRIYCPPNTNILLEFGNLYVRYYTYDQTADDFTMTLVDTEVVVLTESDLDDLHFVSTSQYVYVFCKGKEVIKIYLGPSSSTLVTGASVFANGSYTPTSFAMGTVGPPTGYLVDYAVTLVRNGEESLPLYRINQGDKLPITSTHKNTIGVTATSFVGNIEENDEIRVYRRPTNGGAFGYIGSSTYFYVSGAAVKSTFEDYGGDADFTNGIPLLITKSGLYSVDMKTLVPKTGIVYQQRLLIANLTRSGYTDGFPETILASRPGFQNNFHRDFPYQADSALNFKSGSSGKAEVLRFIEKDGLIVFTTVGVFINIGTLSIDNIALEKKGDWIIDENVPPLVVSDGVFFVEKDTGLVKQLIYSRDILSYQVNDVTIFSNHLFKRRAVTSWTFQDGVVPCIIVTFSDGDFATFTYHSEHQMRAWTRHESTYLVEQVEGTGNADTTFFVVNKDGQRYINISLPRYISPAIYANNPESDKLAANALLDASVIQQTLLNDSLDPGDEFEVTPVVTGDYDGDLTLTCGTSGIFTAGTYGAVGTIMRFFSTTNKSIVDLTVTARASDDEVTVEPSAEFPSAQASGFRLYATFTTVSGLSHLEGETVGIYADGYVMASPNNDDQDYDDVTVASGSITLPNSQRAAIAVVGRPVTADVKTLNITTVEQQNVMLESLNVNKLYIRLHESRGVYVANKFPEEEDGEVDGTSVSGMQLIDEFDVPNDEEIIGNTYNGPLSKRYEKTLVGEWESNGQISLRQVDPVHFEILSIISDAEVLNRRN